ncbi:hypothetical protein C8T65DRAFT_645516 [Cerioporus squamosus]|nr:hypothetical protein C8T65DRAFT_645516 [Cerioporus squamosus]
MFCTKQSKLELQLRVFCVCTPRRSVGSSRTRLVGTDIGANTSRAPSHGKYREISRSPSRRHRPQARSLRLLASTTNCNQPHQALSTQRPSPVC